MRRNIGGDPTLLVLRWDLIIEFEEEWTEILKLAREMKELSLFIYFIKMRRLLTVTKRSKLQLVQTESV